MRYVIAGMLLLTLAGAAWAGGVEEGDKEATFRVSYADTDFGSQDGLDFGSVEDTEISVAYGWVVKGGHEFGFLAGYINQKIKGGDIFGNSSSDGTTLGGFYNYNFGGGGGSVTPYVGAAVSVLGGDIGDAYDMQYGAEVGIKVYPFDHAGFSIGLGYNELTSDMSGLPDASSISLGAGLLLKY